MEHLYLTPDDRLQAAFDKATPGSVIHVSAGVYRQKTVIRTPGLTIIEDDAGLPRAGADDG